MIKLDDISESVADRLTADGLKKTMSKAPWNRDKPSLIRNILRSSFIKCHFSNYQWYRKWYGGRWEQHYIDICHSFIWLNMTPPEIWPEWRQPCSYGTPTIEDW